MRRRERDRSSCVLRARDRERKGEWEKEGWWDVGDWREGRFRRREIGQREGRRDDASSFRRGGGPLRFRLVEFSLSSIDFERVSHLTRFEIERDRELPTGGKRRGGEKRKEKKREKKRKKYPRGATCATLSVEGCAEARYHEDPLSPSDPFSALLPTSTFHPATPRCLRGRDRANSTDHRAFLASLASTRCNPFSPPLLRNPVLEARSLAYATYAIANGRFFFFSFYRRGIDFASFSFFLLTSPKGPILPIRYPYHVRSFTTRTTSGTAPESRTSFNECSTRDR